MTISSDTAYSAWLLSHPNATICTHHREAFAQGYEENASVLQAAQSELESWREYFGCDSKENALAQEYGEKHRLIGELQRRTNIAENDRDAALARAERAESDAEHAANAHEQAMSDLELALRRAYSTEGEMGAMWAAMGEEWEQSRIGTWKECRECHAAEKHGHRFDCARGRFFALASASESTPTLLQAVEEAIEAAAKECDEINRIYTEGKKLSPADASQKMYEHFATGAGHCANAIRSLSPTAIVQGMGVGQ